MDCLHSKRPGTDCARAVPIANVSRALLLLGCAAVLSGCATFNPARDNVAIEQLLVERGSPALGWDRNGSAEADPLIRTWLEQPMTVDLAVKAAMLKSPRLQQVYGELGLARADVIEAVQVSNPHVGLSRLALANGPGSQFAFGVAAPLLDLLTLPAKARLAHLDYERARYEVAASILGISLDVEASWYRYIGAQQVADMRVAVAEALQVSVDLAQRFYDAGNITELQLNRELAAASQARIGAAQASVAARLARLELNSIIGLSASEAGWKTATVLPLPVAHEDEAAELQRIARASSIELLAARKGAEFAASAARITRTFRLLGTTTVGYDREGEVDRSVIRGPTLDLELPIFNQGGARVARAEARLRLARARLAQIELASGGAIEAGTDRVRVMSEIVGIYRQALVPQREVVTRQSQLEQNFALIGEFEVLQAKTQEYDAYQGFLEAVRDYWLARVELTRLVGSRLPSEAQAKQNTPSVEQILAPPAGPAIDHSHHHGAHHGATAAPPAGTSGAPAMEHSAHGAQPDTTTAPPAEAPPAPAADHSGHGDQPTPPGVPPAEEVLPQVPTEPSATPPPARGHVHHGNEQ